MTKKICAANTIMENNIADTERKKFSQNILNTNVIACVHRHPSETELEKAEQDAFIGLKALNSIDALQEMLAAQMLSIHQLQQQATAFANKVTHQESIQYYTNAVKHGGITAQVKEFKKAVKKVLLETTQLTKKFS